MNVVRLIIVYPIFYLVIKPIVWIYEKTTGKRIGNWFG